MKKCQVLCILFLTQKKEAQIHLIQMINNNKVKKNKHHKQIEFQQSKYKRQEINYKKKINLCQKFYKKLNSFKIQPIWFAAEQAFKDLFDRLGWNNQISWDIKIFDIQVNHWKPYKL